MSHSADVGSRPQDDQQSQLVCQLNEMLRIMVPGEIVQAATRGSSRPRTSGWRSAQPSSSSAACPSSRSGAHGNSECFLRCSGRAGHPCGSGYGGSRSGMFSGWRCANQAQSPAAAAPAAGRGGERPRHVHSRASRLRSQPGQPVGVT